MQTHARLVIVGSGIVGCSIAYHLTQLGWRDIVVVDKGSATKPKELAKCRGYQCEPGISKPMSAATVVR